jgi:hypothetical protein
MKFNWISITIGLIMMMHLSMGIAATNKNIKKKIDRAPNGKLLRLTPQRDMISGKKQLKHYQLWSSPHPPTVRQYPEM